MPSASDPNTTPILDLVDLVALCGNDPLTALRACEAHTNRAYGLDWAREDLPDEVDDLLTSTYWSDSFTDDLRDLADEDTEG